VLLGRSLFGIMPIFNAILFMIGITYKPLPLDEINGKLFQERIKKRNLEIIM
jgi:hypothetical protein